MIHTHLMNGKIWKAKSRIPMESWKFCDGFSMFFLSQFQAQFPSLPRSMWVTCTLMSPRPKTWCVELRCVEVQWDEERIGVSVIFAHALSCLIDAHKTTTHVHVTISQGFRDPQNGIRSSFRRTKIFFGAPLDFPLGNALRDLQLCGACGLDPCLPGQCVPQVSWPWP